MLDILTGLIIGAGMEMPPSEEHIDHVASPVRIKLSRFELLRASFHRLFDIGEYLPYRPTNEQYSKCLIKLITLYRLMIANHFETIPYDLEHPIVFQENRFSYSPLEEYCDFLSP